MSTYRQLRVICTLYVRPWPTDTTQTYRFSARAMAPASGLVEGRIVEGGYGDIVRHLSTLDGEYDVDVWRLEFDDQDHFIRALLRDPATKNYKRWELKAELISEEGYNTGATPRIGWRGKVDKVSLLDGLRVIIESRDLLSIDLDRELPLWRFGEDWSGLHEFPPDIADHVVPLVYGECSDHGATLDGTSATASAEKGLVPVKYVGKTLISAGYPGTPGTAPSYLSPPTNLEITVYNPGGLPTHSVRCGVTAVTNFGETTLSNIVTVADYPKLQFSDSLVPGLPNRVSWDWTAPEPSEEVIGYRIYALDDSTTGTPRYRLDMNYNPAGNAADQYIDDGDDRHDKGMYPPPPTTNTAQLAAGTPGTPGSGPLYWDTYVVCAGALSWDQVDIYASNVLGAPPERTLMDPTIWGKDFIGPNDAEWPHDDPWVERNGRRFTVFYGRGPRSFHHVSGVVAIALNIPGYTENADATGGVLVHGFRVIQHLLSNWAGLDVDQTTYKTGSWLGLPTFADGVERLQSSLFTDGQTTSGFRLGTAVGYKLRFVIDEPMTVRDVLRHASLGLAAYWRTSCQGQLGPRLIDETMVPSSGALWRDRIEIKRWLPPIVDERVCSKMAFKWDYDAEARRFREEDGLHTDRDLADEYGGPIAYYDDPLELRFVGDRATAQDVSSRLFRLMRRPRRIQPLVLGLMGLATDLGDVRRFTHYNGPGELGDVETPGFAVSHRLSASNEEVTVGLLDLTEFFEDLTPMVTTIELGGSHVTPIASTSYVDVPGRLTPTVRAGDFYNWTLSLIVQRWCSHASATIQVRVVDEDDTVVAEMASPVGTTTIADEETITSIALPATTKAIRLQAKVNDAAYEGFALATLLATRS